MKYKNPLNQAAFLFLFLSAAFFWSCDKNNLLGPEGTQGNWIPPIGIPRPEFGIEETYRMYDNPEKRNPALSYVLNDEGGFYTHYVDISSPAATDSNNPFGSKEKPRASFPNPSDVPPGSVIEVHTGVYTFPSTFRYILNGTREWPIFLRGYSQAAKPHLKDSYFYLNCTYLIFENFERTGKGIVVRSYESNEAHHVSIRNCEVHNCDEGIYATCWDNGKPANHVVIYNNHIHPDNFDPADGAFPQRDVTGVYLHRNSHDVWVVDNLIHHAAGDAVGGGHGANYSARNYFIGRNTMHTCGENAIDLKEVENVVISQNVMYNFQGWSSGDNGGAFITHLGPDFSPRNVWFIYNEIYGEMDGAIFIGGEQKYPVYIIGNLIRDISRPDGSAMAFKTWSSKQIFFINNTIVDCDNGIDSYVDGPLVELHLYNNIVANIKPGGFHLNLSGKEQLKNSVSKNNLYFQSGGNPRLNCNRISYDNLTDFNTATGMESGSLIDNPLFVNPAGNDFSLQAGSPAINKGTNARAYIEYELFFGKDIKFDFSGNQRPANKLWDIGAFEYK
jgi:hypothetical protein